MMSNILKLKWAMWGFISGLSLGLLYAVLSKQRSNLENHAMADVTKVAQQFIRNRISHADSLNYGMFSNSMIDFHRASGMPDPSAYSRYIQSVDPLDSAELLGVVLLDQDRARVFVGQVKGQDFSIVVYKFIKQATEWKFNGYEFDYDFE